MSAVVATRDGPVSIVTTHLAVRQEDAGRQLQAVLLATGDLPAPVVLTGDLNMAPTVVRSALESAGFEMAAAAPTFPADVPRAQIDHVAVRGGIVVNASVMETLASDHRCLVVDLDVG
jgi:endonuclease/exonuclease/phosphatase family metal-dependent hydrolase